MANFKLQLEQQLSILEQDSLLRTIEDSDNIDPPYIVRNNKKLISFCSNDYFGLSHNHEVKQAAIDTIEQYGVGSGASRLVSGNNHLYNILESQLRQTKNTEAAIVFGSGYLANLSVITSLCSKQDMIVADRLIHASLIDAILLSGAKLFRFKHNDPESCESILKKQRSKFRNCFIITETIFSMDGDKAPIKELVQLKQKYDSILIADDAHGIGFIDEYHKQGIDIQIGTLSKAIGSYGGYVCCDELMAKYLINKARPLIYTTALPPSIIAAAIKALEIINNSPTLARTALENASYFCSKMNLNPPSSAIIPYIIGENDKAVKLSKQLLDNNILVQAIRPPTVPKATARLRLTFSSAHKREDVDLLVGVLLKQECII